VGASSIALAMGSVWVAEPSLDDPALVEGLPGVGHVGKLVAEHVIAEADSELGCRVHSEYLE
ncbi:PAC2 family protein, partial [Serratia marcescens]|uniref:PAC2 family protein n=1 Tax=Serratia marcescens TaxID=615 RepID=UPI0019533E1E